MAERKPVQNPNIIFEKDRLVDGVRQEVIDTQIQKSIEAEHSGKLVIFDSQQDPKAILDEDHTNYLRRLFRL